MSTTNVILIIYLTTFDRILKTPKMKKNLNNRVSRTSQLYKISIIIYSGLFLLVINIPILQAQTSFSMDDILSSPFPESLTASSEGTRILWKGKVFSFFPWIYLLPSHDLLHKT